MQNITEERNKNFFNHDWESHMKSFEISLRKKKRQKIFASKRSLPSSLILEISQFDPTLPSSFTSISSFLHTFHSAPYSTNLQISTLLSNLAYKGESEVELLIKCNAIEFCLNYIPSVHHEISERLLLTLSNIAATGCEYRKAILDSKILEVLVKMLFEQELAVGMIKKIGLCVQNLVQADSKLSSEQLDIVFVMLENLILVGFPKIDLSCLNLMVNLSFLGYLERLSADCFLQFLMNKAKDLSEIKGQVLALNVLNNFMSGTERYMELLVNGGIFQVIQENLQSTNVCVLKKICIILGFLIESPVSVPTELLLCFLPCVSHPDLSVKTEASFVLECLTHLSSPIYYHALVSHDLFSHIYQTLQIKSPKIIKNILQLMKHLMKTSEHNFEFFKESFLVSGCYEALETSQLHCERHLSDQITNFLSEYIVEEVLSDYEANL